MKLDKVILSSDDNPDYLEFWPIVSEAWRNIGIEPISSRKPYERSATELIPHFINFLIDGLSFGTIMDS